MPIWHIEQDSASELCPSYNQQHYEIIIHPCSIVHQVHNNAVSRGTGHTWRDYSNFTYTMCNKYFNKLTSLYIVCKIVLHRCSKLISNKLCEDIYAILRLSFLSSEVCTEIVSLFASCFTLWAMPCTTSDYNKYFIWILNNLHTIVIYTYGCQTFFIGREVSRRSSLWALRDTHQVTVFTCCWRSLCKSQYLHGLFTGIAK